MNDFKTEYKKIYNDYSNSSFNVWIQKLRRISKNREVILYGCGNLCEIIFGVFRQNEIIISAISDTYKYGEYQGLSITTPNELYEKFGNGIVVITSNSYERQIRDMLLFLGFGHSQIISVPAAMCYHFSYEEFKKKHFDGFQWAYEFFHDEVSKKIILNRIRMHLLGEELLKTSIKPEYFEIQPSNDEVFVQAGCYDGNTVIEFINQAKMMNTSYLVYSFEANPYSYNISMSNLANYSNVELVAKGLWSQETTLDFALDQNGGSSFVIGNLNTPISVISLDSFFKKKMNPPTFIQLDIEGAEFEALKGSENIIRKYKPKLAICVYHKPEDIYEIPKLLSTFRSDYKFWLQQCYTGLWDTILYAI